MRLNVRDERPRDVDAIRAIHAAAFPTRAEAVLVDRLRHEAPVISLVAESGGLIVGHILFSPVTLPGIQYHAAFADL